jgi:hypothetical protein
VIVARQKQCWLSLSGLSGIVVLYFTCSSAGIAAMVFGSLGCLFPKGSVVIMKTTGQACLCLGFRRWGAQSVKLETHTLEDGQVAKLTMVVLYGCCLLSTCAGSAPSVVVAC